MPSGRIAVALVASGSHAEPPPLSRRYAVRLARSAAWRASRGNRATFRRLMREWLNANPRPTRPTFEIQSERTP